MNRTTYSTKMRQTIRFGTHGGRLLGLMLLWSLATPAFAQHHLFGGGMGMGGYAGPVLKYSAVDGAPAFFLGGRAGIVIALDSTNSLSVGGGMYGLMTGVEASTPELSGEPRYLQFGYGGIELEYTLRPGNLLHLSTSTLLGVGRADYDADDYAYGAHGFGHAWGGGPAFFVAEPGVGATLNLTPFLRLGLGASYRFVGGGLQQELRAVRLSGPAGMLSLQVGRHL